MLISRRVTVKVYRVGVVLYSLCVLAVFTVEIPQEKGPLYTGAWSSWGEWSACSQPCGSGISSQKRYCRSVRCVGSKTRYRSCNYQPCTTTLPDLRTQQCSSFDAYTQQGSLVRWASVEPQPDEEQCMLVCHSLMEGYVHVLRSGAADGSRCHKGRGVCLGGQCVEMGCDGMVGSTLSADPCQRCLYADNSTSPCRHYQGQAFRAPSEAVQVVASIPAGAWNLNITSLGGTEASIKLSTPNETSVVVTTGHPSTMHLGALDVRLSSVRRCPHCGVQWSVVVAGPTTTIVDITVLHTTADIAVVFSYNMVESRNIGVARQHTAQASYEQGQPRLSKRAMKRASVPIYWAAKPPTACSVTCGNGTQTVFYECHYRSNFRTVNIPERYCSSYRLPRPPPLVETCQRPDCQNEWLAGDWGECSQACGTAVRTREVHCYRAVSEQESILVNSTSCNHLPQPPPQEACPTLPCQARWIPGSWLECQGPCGSGLGVQRRVVQCHNSSGSAVSHRECSGSNQPTDRQPCSRACTEARWMVYSWGQCSSGSECGQERGYRRRVVQCEALDEGRNVVTIDDNCPLPRPPTHQSCHVNCGWQAGNWSTCHGDCGTGLQNRSVQCVAGGREVSGCTGPAPSQRRSCALAQPCCTARQLPTQSCQHLQEQVRICSIIRNMSNSYCCQFCSQLQTT